MVDWVSVKGLLDYFKIDGKLPSRTFIHERRAAGDISKPEAYIGHRPVWTPETARRDAERYLTRKSRPHVVTPVDPNAPTRSRGRPRKRPLPQIAAE